MSKRFVSTRLGRVLGAALLVAVAVPFGSTPASAVAYVPIAGEGSTWSANAVNQWITDVHQFGMRISYTPDGSSAGRQAFINGTTDFAASDIPFQTVADDGSPPEKPPVGDYAYMPVTAGGTTFMYNLEINGQRVTNLRLSGENIAKIFTGQITNWDNPALAADNPGITLPNRQIVPVVRSDGAGSTAQFVLWMISQYPSIWNAYCSATGRAPACGETSYYPTLPGMIAQSGDQGVAGYVAQGFAQGSIGYVEYSYALQAGFPVAEMLNSAGYYTVPSPQNVAVSLLQDKVDTTDVNNPQLYLTQQLGGVYTDPDPRTYPLSSYSYLILPTAVQGQFTTAKGGTLAAFSYYAMCQGQQESGSLGYSPMPINLVEAAFAQIKKIPGAVVQNINIQSCNNPTFSTTGVNTLATTAPQPLACDKQGPIQCSHGSGGDLSTTEVTGASLLWEQQHGGSQPVTTTPPTPGKTTTSGTTVPGRTSQQTIPGSSSAASLPSSSTTSVAACNVDTGDCSSSSANSTQSGGASASPAQQAQIADATLPASSGWTGTQTLMILVGLLLILVVVAPGLVLRYSRKGRS